LKTKEKANYRADPTKKKAASKAASRASYSADPEKKKAASKAHYFNSPKKKKAASGAYSKKSYAKTLYNLTICHYNYYAFSRTASSVCSVGQLMLYPLKKQVPI